MSSLQKHVKFYRAHQEQFVKEHYGQFVLIHQDSVEDFFDSEINAYQIAKEKFPPGSFLIRPCVNREEEASAIFRSRVAG